MAGTMSQPPVLRGSAKGRLAGCVVATAVLCGLAVAASFPFAAAQNEWTQLFGVLGMGVYLLAWGLAALFAWTEQKGLRLLALLPLAVCLGSCAGSTMVGQAVREAQFASHLPRYEALVERIRAANVLVSGKVVSVPLAETERDLGYSVLAEQDANGILMVELLTGGGFPVKHSGFLYSSSGSIKPWSFFDERWPSKTEVRPKWFRISD